MKLIEGSKQRYFLKNETPKECDIGQYYLKEEDDFTVGLYYNDGIEIRQVAKYTREYSKKVSEERLEEVIKEYYD